MIIWDGTKIDTAGMYEGIPMDDFFERYASKIDRNAPSGCWLWMGATNRTVNGYGMFRVKRVAHYAHRAASAATHGELPKGAIVMHRCDTPLCCNPAHLCIGSQADNLKDMANKGRNFSNGLSKNAKLSKNQAEMARLMLKLGVSQKDVASVLGVTQGTISRLASGKVQSYV